MTTLILLLLVFAHCIIFHLSSFNLFGIMFRWKQYVIGDCTCLKTSITLMSVLYVCFLSLLMFSFPPFYFVLYDYNISLIFHSLTHLCVCVCVCTCVYLHMCLVVSIRFIEHSLSLCTFL